MRIEHILCDTKTKHVCMMMFRLLHETKKMYISNWYQYNGALYDISTCSHRPWISDKYYRKSTHTLHYSGCIFDEMGLTVYASVYVCTTCTYKCVVVHWCMCASHTYVWVVFFTMRQIGEPIQACTPNGWMDTDIKYRITIEYFWTDMWRIRTQTHTYIHKTNTDSTKVNWGKKMLIFRKIAELPKDFNRIAKIIKILIIHLIWRQTRNKLTHQLWNSCDI